MTLIEIFRNCTRLGGATQTPFFFSPWCCKAMGPRGATPGNSAWLITSSPLCTTVSRLPRIVISKLFQAPMSRSALRFGVTPARTAAGIDASVR